MQKINIFLSCDKKGKETKEELSNFIRFLNNTYVDRGIFFQIFTSENKNDCKEKIDDSDLFLMIVINEVENKEFFEEALSHFYKDENPKIIPYIKEKKEYSKSATEFMNYLGKEIGHFYKTFKHIDSLKLGIVTHIKSFGFDDLSINNNMIELDGKPVLLIENIDMFANSEDLNNLKKQFNELDQEYFNIKKKYLTNKEEFQEEYDDISNKRKTVKQELEILENNLLEFAKNISYQKASHRMIEASNFLEKGLTNYALEILDDNEIFLEIEENLKKGKQEALKVNFAELMMKLNIPSKIVNDNSKMYYEKLYDLYSQNHEICEEYPIYYANYLLSVGDYKQARYIMFEVEPYKNKFTLQQYFDYYKCWAEIYSYRNTIENSIEDAATFTDLVDKSDLTFPNKYLYYMRINNIKGKLHYEFAQFDDAANSFRESLSKALTIIKDNLINQTNKNIFIKECTFAIEYFIRSGIQFNSSDFIGPLYEYKKLSVLSKNLKTNNLNELNIHDKIDYYYINRAQMICLIKEKKYEEALKCFPENIEQYFKDYLNDCFLGSEKADILKFVGLCYFGLQNFVDGFKYYEEAIKEYKENITTDEKKYYIILIEMYYFLWSFSKLIKDRKKKREYRKKYMESVNNLCHSIENFSLNEFVKQVNAKIHKEMEL